VSAETQLDVLEDALPPTSRFVAWIDATMRGDADLARKLEEGGERIHTSFVWKPFGFYVHAALEVAESFWHEVHVAYLVLQALNGHRLAIGYMLESINEREWLELDDAAREAHEWPDVEEHRSIVHLDELRQAYHVKLAANWRGLERFAHGEGFDARMMLYALEWPAELMEEIEEIVELVADVHAPNERVEYSRRLLLAIYSKQITRLSGNQCETRAYPETLTIPDDHVDGRA
jgi:hypothetical protein